MDNLAYWQKRSPEVRISAVETPKGKTLEVIKRCNTHNKFEYHRRTFSFMNFISICKPNKCLVFLIIVVLYNNSLFCQWDLFPGYIIKSNGDTIYGLINSGGPKANAKYCHFKKNENAEIIKYTPSELTGYRFIDGKYYVSYEIPYQKDPDELEGIVTIETGRKYGVPFIKKIISEQEDSIIGGYENHGVIKKKVFLEFLIKGRIDFYVYYNSNGNPQYFSKIGNGNLVELENTKGVALNQYEDDFIIEKKEYIGQLRSMLNDCEGINPKITSTNLENKSLINLAKYYHDKTCTDSDGECIIYEKSNMNIHTLILPVLGFSRMKVTASELTEAYENEFIINGMITFGVLFNFSNFQGINDNFSVQTGLTFQNQHFESGDGLTSMVFNVISMPLGLKYTFLLNTNIQPFIGLAVCPNLRLSTNIESDYPHYTWYKLKKVPIDFLGQIGSNYRINKRLFLSGSIQYKMGKSFYSYSIDKSKYREFGIYVGLGYRVVRE